MEITLGQYQYNVRDIDADEGSFLAMKLVNKLRQIMSSEASDNNTSYESNVSKEEAVHGTISLIMMNMDEAEYKTIQTKALALVDRMEQVGAESVGIPIIRNGKLIHADLKKDVTTIMQLTLESLYHNLSPFFSENGLKLVMTGKV
jgi:hypothetical protein